MVSYPIRVPRKHYKGSNPSQRAQIANLNRMAEVIEQYINARLENLPPEEIREYKVFTYGEISNATGISLETVRELGLGIDGGHNGFTVAPRPEAL